MTRSTSSLSALLLSDDLHAATTSAKLLESYGFSVSKTDSAVLARELCRGKKFDLAVYDQDTAGASELSSLDTPHVVLGLVGPRKAREVAGKRVHFMVQKPFTNDLFGKTLKAAYGVIALGRRRKVRHDTCLEAMSASIVHGGQRRNLNMATIVNVSRTGMCLQTQEILPQEADLQISFSLPSDGQVVKASGTVVWSHANGRAGITLNKFDSQGRTLYNDWLTSLSATLDDVFLRIQASDRVSQDARC